MIKNLDLISDVIYLIEADTHKLIWTNEYTKKLYGEINEDEKCYKYFFNRNTPCTFCQKCKKDKVFVNDVKTKITKNFKTTDVLISYRNTTENNINYKYVMVQRMNEVLKDYNELKNFKDMHYEFFKTMSKMNLKMGIEKKLYQVIKCVKQIFVADRTLLINGENTELVECRSKKVEPYKIDDLIFNVFFKNIDYFTEKLKNKYHVNISVGKMKNDSELKKVLVDNNIKEIIYMRWTLDQDVYHLMIENPKKKSMDENFYCSLSNFLYYVFRSIQYNRMLFYLSNVDTLTECYNRNYYKKVLRKYAEGEFVDTGVLYLDLNNLKEINDQYGHSVGDRTIIMLGSVLKSIFPIKEVFKIGGDEFVVIKSNCSFDKFQEKTSLLQKKLKEHKISCSYGVSYRADDVDINEMIEIAEREMYANKKRYHFLESNATYDIEFTNFIKKDIDNNVFFIVMQPKINPYTNELYGGEVLVRAKGKNTTIFPNSFIPVFEKNNCIHFLDYFVVEESCKLLRRLIDEYNFEKLISLNISRETFLINDFHQEIIKIYDKYNIPHNRIILEITEKMDASVDEIVYKCNEMGKDGFIFEVDDFGSYFSNIGLLSSDSFYAIKVDKSIVRVLNKESITKDIIRFVIERCHDKNILVVAEGVETEEEFNEVCKMNFDAIQGYYYDKPLEIKEFINKYIKKAE